MGGTSAEYGNWFLVAGEIFSLMGVVTFGRSLILPNAQSGAVSSINQARGTASGMMGFMQLMMGTAASQLMPVLYGLGILPVRFKLKLARIRLW